MKRRLDTLPPEDCSGRLPKALRVNRTVSHRDAIIADTRSRNVT
ncbi:MULTISPECIES: hypothetical protein [Chromohalobacter]|nr:MULTISPECIES: hypothetical protein [Chromohalobacter]